MTGRRVDRETWRDLPGYEVPGRVCEGMEDVEELMSNVKCQMSNVKCNKCKLILLR